MKEGKVKLYKFEELGEDVRMSIVDNKRWEVQDSVMSDWNDSQEDTLKAFCDIFRVKMGRWSVGYCAGDCYFNFDFNDEAIWEDIYHFTPDMVCGKYLRRFINNYVYNDILKGKYFSTNGYVDENGKYHYRYRYSKVSFDRHNCNLTGVCYDEDILDRVWKVYDKPIPDDYSLRDLVQDCLDDFFSAWHEEYEYWGENDEAIEEELTNWYEDDWFYADGTMFKGILEDAA